jgi:hypothetical protein
VTVWGILVAINPEFFLCQVFYVGARIFIWEYSLECHFWLYFIYLIWKGLLNTHLSSFSWNLGNWDKISQQIHEVCQDCILNLYSLLHSHQQIDCNKGTFYNLYSQVCFSHVCIFEVITFTCYWGLRC